MIISERLAAFALLAALLGNASLARAEPGGDPQTSFDEGRALMKAGRFGEAALKFEQSVALRPTGGALLNLGDCMEKLGRYASAANAFDRARELAERAGEGGRADEARARAASLRPAMSTLTVRAPALDGLTVTLDDRAVVLGVVSPLDGGEHVVHASAPCHRPFDARIMLGIRADAQQLVVVPIRSDDPACSGAPPPPPVVVRREPPPEPTGWSAQRKVAVVTLGGGVVALGIGAFFGLAAAGKKSDLEAACTSYPRGCPPERRAELDGISDDASRAASISTIAFVAGAALLAGAIVLWITAPKRQALRSAMVPLAGVTF